MWVVREKGESQISKLKCLVNRKKFRIEQNINFMYKKCDVYMNNAK